MNDDTPSAEPPLVKDPSNASPDSASLRPTDESSSASSSTAPSPYVNGSVAGPLSAAANAAATRLAPVASELRARVPASRAALDAAGRVVTQAARDTDAVLHRELQNPETQRLRDTGREFFLALASASALYFSRALSVAERKLHISTTSAGSEEPVIKRLQTVALASMLILRKKAFQVLPGHAGSVDTVSQSDNTVPQAHVHNESAISKVIDIFREVAFQAKVIVAEGALRMSQYRGDYHEYVTPVARRVAAICNVSDLSRRETEEPVGETVGTLPFFPESSENNLCAMDNPKDA